MKDFRSFSWVIIFMTACSLNAKMVHLCNSKEASIVITERQNSISMKLLYRGKKIRILERDLIVDNFGEENERPVAAYFFGKLIMGFFYTTMPSVKKINDEKKRGEKEFHYETRVHLVDSHHTQTPLNFSLACTIMKL